MKRRKMIVSTKKRLERVNRVVPYLIAAVVSLIIGAAIFWVKGISPFGDQSILCMDLWGQYYPMYVNNSQASGLAGLLYSWNGAFGFNNWSQSSYYCNSIFVFLLRFLPVSRYVTAIDLCCLVKMALSSVTCLAFLQYKLRKTSPVLIAGSVMYSCCAYMLAFLSQPMWTDELFLAPLVLLGLERLIQEKRSVFYTLMLGISIITSFYIGFSLCVFCAFYYLFTCPSLLEISLEEKRPVIRGQKVLLDTTIRFAIFSLLAGAISAVVILPIACALSKTLAVEAAGPGGISWYGTLTELLQNLLPETPLYVQYKGCNIYVGSIVFIALPIYFFNNRIRKTERITSGLFLAFLFASTSCNLLDYVWHGFHFPNQLPGRWTFLLSFYLVFLTCKGIENLEGLSIRRLLGSLVAGTAVICLAVLGVGSQEMRTFSSMYPVLLIGAAIGMILLNLSQKEITLGEKTVWKQDRRLGVLISAVIAFLMMWESGLNGFTIAQFEHESGVQTSNEPSYTEQVLRSEKYGDAVKCGTDEFYRTEAYNGFTFNGSMIGDYNGLSYYSSTMTGNTFLLMKYLGNRVYGDKVSTVYSLSSPVQNGLFGVKKMIDFNRSLPRILPGIELLENAEDADIYQNPTALSLAYVVSDDIFNYTVDDQVRSIENQNNLLNMVLGEEVNVFAPVECSAFTSENATFQESEDWNRNYYFKEGEESTVAFHYTFEIPEDGSYYIEHNFRAGNIHMTAYNFDRNYKTGDGMFFFAGNLKKGDMLQVDVSAENINVGCMGLNLYRFDQNIWNQAYEKLSANELEVTSFTPTRVKGKIVLTKEGTVMATIPQDGGWSVYCDGKKLETKTAAGVFLCATVPSGSHELEYRYQVPGLKAGLGISIAGFLLTVIFGNLRRRKKKSLMEKYNE